MTWYITQCGKDSRILRKGCLLPGSRQLSLERNALPDPLPWGTPGRIQTRTAKRWSLWMVTEIFALLCSAVIQVFPEGAMTMTHSAARFSLLFAYRDIKLCIYRHIEVRKALRQNGVTSHMLGSRISPKWEFFPSYCFASLWQGPEQNQVQQVSPLLVDGRS